MISSKDFDHFLKKGFIEGLTPAAPMHILIDAFGDDFWIVKETEVNGLIYGIIKIGFIEFHIYNEKINGISYRPNLSFPKEDFKGVTMPWIYKKNSLASIEAELSKSNILYKKYTLVGPLNHFRTAGADWISLEAGDHIVIDTEGGVTILFEPNNKNGELEAYQICKYYDIHKQ